MVKTPPFAESVTEGDVRWDKGKLLSLEDDIIPYKISPCFNVTGKFRINKQRFIHEFCSGA